MRSRWWGAAPLSLPRPFMPVHEPNANTTSGYMENEQIPEPRSNVGSLLRATRLRAGINLEQISAGLRIRRAYIAAIEDSNYQALPGAAYAAGFVRAYAEFLGLDSEEVVRRFRTESASTHTSSQLRFPSPLSDRGIPGAALMFVGIVVATVAYGGWYLTTSENNVVAELVGPLPDRLAALLRSDPVVAGAEGDKGQTTSESAPGATAPDGTPSAVARASDPAADETTTAQSAQSGTAGALETAIASAPSQDTTAASSTPATDATVPTTTASNTSGPAPAGSSSASTSVTNTAASGSNAARPLEAAPSRMAATPPTAPPARTVTATIETPLATGTGALVRADAAVQPAPPTATRVTAPADASPRPQPEPGASMVTQRPVSSAAEATQASTVAALPAAPPDPSPASATTGSRITVRAKIPSWIQVRDDARNKLLVTRMMRGGDTYPVPNQPGLTLMTGNAGALEILVDGATVPAVGPLGAVRRNVALDTKRLLDGTAVSE